MAKKAENWHSERGFWHWKDRLMLRRKTNQCMILCHKPRSKWTWKLLWSVTVWNTTAVCSVWWIHTRPIQLFATIHWEQWDKYSSRIWWLFHRVNTRRSVQNFGISFGIRSKLHDLSLIITYWLRWAPLRFGHQLIENRLTRRRFSKAIREVKHDVNGRRQTAKTTSDFESFSFNP